MARVDVATSPIAWRVVVALVRMEMLQGGKAGHSRQPVFELSAHHLISRLQMYGYASRLGNFRIPCSEAQPADSRGEKVIRFRPVLQNNQLSEYTGHF
jgi:hypothetical protein